MTVVRSESLNQAVVSTSGLDKLDDGLTYELWLIHDGVMVPAGTTDGDVSSLLLEGDPRTASGAWTVVAEDRDPELVHVWKPLQRQANPVDPAVVGPSTAEAVWTIPRNTPPGTYRLRHVGASRASQAAAVVPYEGISSPFTIAGPSADCP